MNVTFWRGFVLAPAIAGVLCVSGFPQKHKPVPQAAPKPIIFAVLNDGGTLEPIATVNAGKLTAPANGSDDEKKVAAFDKAYYKAGSSYRLIFGGADAGTVKVKSFDPNAECSRNIAEAATTSTTAALKGFVMGLATNVAAKPGKSFRRKPTAAEKGEMEALALSEFLKEKLTPKELHYQNLTAIDVDHDGTAEFVASYWVEIDEMTRGLLFFIAEKGPKGKYAIGYKDYHTVDQANVMSGDIKDIDAGVYHELLLDSFDYNHDGTAEIFTYTQSFEGANFNVYSRVKGKWAKAYDNSNYHCGY